MTSTKKSLWDLTPEVWVVDLTLEQNLSEIQLPFMEDQFVGRLDRQAQVVNFNGHLS